MADEAQEMVEDAVKEVAKAERKKAGRPRGTREQQLLTREGRLKRLAKLAYDDKAKPADIVAALKLMTDLLNDRAREVDAECPVTTLRFEQDKIPVNAATACPEIPRDATRVEPPIPETQQKQAEKPADVPPTVQAVPPVAADLNEMTLKLEVDPNASPVQDIDL